MQTEKSFFQRLQIRESTPSWSLISVIIFLAAYFGLTIAGQIVAVTLSSDNPSSPSITTLAFGSLIGLIALIVGAALWSRRRLGQNWLTQLHGQATRIRLFPYLLIGLGAAWAIDLIGRVTQLNSGQIVPPILLGLRDPIGAGWVISAILALVVQPLAETLIFQGFAYPALARDLNNNLLAIISTAALYTLLNWVLNTNATTSIWFTLIEPFLMVLVLTAVRAYTQSLRPTLAARIMFGLFFIFSALVLKV